MYHIRYTSPHPRNSAFPPLPSNFSRHFLPNRASTSSSTYRLYIARAKCDISTYSLQTGQESLIMRRSECSTSEGCQQASTYSALPRLSFTAPLLNPTPDPIRYSLSSSAASFFSSRSSRSRISCARLVSSTLTFTSALSDAIYLPCTAVNRFLSRTSQYQLSRHTPQ